MEGLAQTARSRQMYGQVNENVHRFHEQTTARLSELWRSLPHLTLTVGEASLHWRDEVVYEEPPSATNLAFALFSEGIHMLALLPGVEDEELLPLATALELGQSAEASSDLLTRLWRHDFRFVRFEYSATLVDVDDEELPQPNPERYGGRRWEVSEASDGDGAPPGREASDRQRVLARRWRLRDSDVTALESAIEGAARRPLRRDVLRALLDQLELREPDRRRRVEEVLAEVAGETIEGRAWDELAYVVGEMTHLADTILSGDDRRRVRSLIERLAQQGLAALPLISQPEALPDDRLLTRLIAPLSPEAIVDLVRARLATPWPHLEAALEEAIHERVADEPEAIDTLLTDEEAAVVSAGIELAAQHGYEASADRLVALLDDGSEDVRVAAVTALGTLGVSGVNETLMGYVDDPSDRVRRAIARALAAVGGRHTGQRLLERARQRAFRQRPTDEKRQYLEAAAQIVGNEAFEDLHHLLHHRRCLGLMGPYDEGTRAAAARALGHLSSPKAHRSLRKARSADSPVVRAAARQGIEDRDREEGSR